MPVLVEGDPGQLHQVFVNLLLNGIEAMPDGGELCVAVQNAAVPEGDCRVTVTDSGSGIAAPHPGADVRTLRHEQGTGHGVGLGHQPPDRPAARGEADRGESRGTRRLFSVELPRCSGPPHSAGGSQGEVSSDQQAVPDPTSCDRSEAHHAPTADH